MRKPRLTTAVEIWGNKKEILCGIFTASSKFRGSLCLSRLRISRLNENFNVKACLVDDKKSIRKCNKLENVRCFVIQPIS
jgi:hypothetical protein